MQLRLLEKQRKQVIQDKLNHTSKTVFLADLRRIATVDQANAVAAPASKDTACILRQAMAQSYAEFGDLDIQQSGGQDEAEFGALEIQQAQVLFSALKTLRQGQPPLAWESEAAAEIEVRSDPGMR